MSQPLDIKETFSAFLQDNLNQVIEKFVSEGDINWSVKHAMDGVAERFGTMIVGEAQSKITAVLSPSLWEEIKDSEHNFVTQIKDKSLRENLDPVSVLQDLGKITSEDYEFLKDKKSFKDDNQELITTVDEIVTIVYVLHSSKNFIANLSGKSESLYIFRSISTDDPDTLLKKMLKGESERGLGVSWSRSLSKARSYDGDYTENTYHIKLHGTIPLDSIDLLMTIVKNISGFSSEEEFFLKEKENISVHRIQIFNHKYDLLATHELETPFIHHS